MPFTVQLPGSDVYSLVFVVADDGMALIADADGIFGWHSLDGAKLGTFYMDPYQTSWWQNLMRSAPVEHDHADTTRRALSRRRSRVS